MCERTAGNTVHASSYYSVNVARIRIPILVKTRRILPSSGFIIEVGRLGYGVPHRLNSNELRLQLFFKNLLKLLHLGSHHKGTVPLAGVIDVVVLMVGFGGVEGLRSVSYTHLDVYKRQIKLCLIGQ